MRILSAVLLIIAMAGGLSACADSKESSPVNKENAMSSAQATTVFTGTIVYKQFEGGFFALLTNDNQRYTLRHLPTAYRLDGLVVEINGSVNKDIITTTQFGELLEVNTVKVLDDSHASPPKTGPRKLKSL